MTSAPHEDTETGYEPVDPELVDGAAGLLARLEATTTWDLATWMHHAGTYEELTDKAELIFDLADSYGEDLEPETVAHLIDTLDGIAQRIVAAEQDDALARETLLAARAECPVEPGDEELVTVAVRVDSRSFHTRRADIVTLLLRQLIGNGFDGSYRLVVAPRWLVTRLENRALHTTIWIVETIDDIPDRNVLDVANGLWEPQQQGPYRAPADAINAARLLVA